MKKFLYSLISFCLIFFISFSVTSCNAKINAELLNAKYDSGNGETKSIDSDFIKGYNKFSLELFNRSKSKSKNTLISPLSALTCLSMIANGANGKTLEEMENVLCGIKIQEMNKYLSNIINNSNDNTKLANSVWINKNQNFVENNSFLSNLSSFYNAEVYRCHFDNIALKDINNWCKNKTNKMIDKILDEIDNEILMYLINALSFDSKWEIPYEKDQINDSFFTDFNGQTKSVKMLNSSENLYLENENFKGFIKPYKDNKYSFIGLLPNSIDNIDSLNGDDFYSLINNASSQNVSARIPEFSFDYELLMNRVLQDMGIVTAFNPSLADFKNMGTSNANIYLSFVLQKCKIELNANGTKASAITIGGAKTESAMPENKTIILDRPFVFSIFDNENNIPLFLGKVLSI